MSTCCHILSNSLALPFNRTEHIARALVYARQLPASVGRAVPTIDAAQLLALIAAAALAPRLLDALPTAQAFHGLREQPGSNSGAATFGAFFAGLMADARPDQIEIELTKIIDAGHGVQYMALVTINGTRTMGFGDPPPPHLAREEVVRISPRAFAQLRRDFNSSDPVYAREFAP